MYVCKVYLFEEFIIEVMLSSTYESNILCNYEYDPFMLDFHLSKLLKILLKIHAQQSTHLDSDSEAVAEYYLFLMICGKKNTWSF